MPTVGTSMNPAQGRAGWLVLLIEGANKREQKALTRGDVCWESHVRPRLCPWRCAVVVGRLSVVTRCLVLRGGCGLRRDRR